MERIFATGSIVALAMVGFAGSASAAPADAACFGQVHKKINTEGLLAPDFNNVGELVKAAGGQGKNAAAKDACSP